MKKLILLFACTFIGTLAQAQLSDTKWSGNLAVPEIIQVTLNFKADLFEVLVAESGEQLESMAYKVSGDTLTLKKTAGGSPCPEGSEFKVRFSIQGDKLLITPIADDCPMRAESWTKEPFTKVKQ